MAETKIPPPSDLLGPKPQRTNLEAPINAASNSGDLPFDPEALKRKYIEERDKRLKYGQSQGGIDQYCFMEENGPFAHYLRDPWVKPGFRRNPVDELVDVLIIGGGFGAQLVAVRLIEAGVTNLRIIEKAGDFGGTWSVFFAICSSLIARGADLADYSLEGIGTAILEHSATLNRIFICPFLKNSTICQPRNMQERMNF